jgi:prolipoprotein diacylglyceryltransferase
VAFPPGSVPAVFHAQQQLVPHDSWSLPVHPLQVYFGLTGVLITVLATWMLPRRRYPGQVALVGLLVFSASAYWLEPFRQAVGSRPFIGSYPQLQVVAGGLVAIAMLGLMLCELRSQLLRGAMSREAAQRRRRDAVSR